MEGKAIDNEQDGIDEKGTSILESLKEESGEKAILLEKARRLTPRSALKFYYAAVGVSWVSVVVSLCLGIVAMLFAIRENSQLLFSFGLDSILDAVSSLVVLWRFHGGNSIYSEERERRACVVVGFLFILSACILLVKSIIALVNGQLAHKPALAITLSIINGVLCVVLGFSKVFVGFMLESRVLITDSVITLTGALMSVCTAVFATIYSQNFHVWYIDDVIGLMCSVFLTCYGIWVVWTSVSEIRKTSRDKQ